MTITKPPVNLYCISKGSDEKICPFTRWKPADKPNATFAHVCNVLSYLGQVVEWTTLLRIDKRGYKWRAVCELEEPCVCSAYLDEAFAIGIDSSEFPSLCLCSSTRVGGTNLVLPDSDNMWSESTSPIWLSRWQQSNMVSAACFFNRLIIKTNKCLGIVPVRFARREQKSVNSNASTALHTRWRIFIIRKIHVGGSGVGYIKRNFKPGIFLYWPRSLNSDGADSGACSYIGFSCDICNRRDSTGRSAGLRGEGFAVQRRGRR